MVSAHVVPLKGAVLDWVIQQCARDLERLGHYGQVTLKSDQEPAVVDDLREISNLGGSRGTFLEHSLVADSQSNGLIERGISRGDGPISVDSPVFLWLVEHATDILNKCHVASDGKSACGRLKKRPHRGELGGLMTERWHLETRLGKRFHTEEHIVARTEDGLVIRSRAVKAKLEETTMEDVDAIKGSPWASAGVFERCTA